VAKTSPAQSDEESRDQSQRAECQAAVIAAAVMGALGDPPDFRRVTVVKLWGNQFRVNVLTGYDSASARVAHSYFLTADEAGQVLASEPAIARLY
jgi:hypothetical protein